MNVTEKRTIQNVIKQLRGEDCSPEVRAALTGPAKLYLETWVISALELLVKDDRKPNELKLAEELTR